MTEPDGGPPAPKGQGSWQDPGTGPAAGGFQAAAVEPGPAPGVSYADLVTRVIAYVIDFVLLGIAIGIVATILVIPLAFLGGVVGALIAFVIIGGLSLFGTAIYFVYFWTTMRASPGQKILGLETVNAGDGATLTRDQAIKRWAYLFGPGVAVSVASFTLGNSALGFLVSLLSLAVFGYTLYLLYTASQSTKRQGYHDVQAATVVVKRTAA
jgi:uncharacterized RDD family membrane protein YckC